MPRRRAGPSPAQTVVIDGLSLSSPFSASKPFGTVAVRDYDTPFWGGVFIRELFVIAAIYVAHNFDGALHADSRTPLQRFPAHGGGLIP